MEKQPSFDRAEFMDGYRAALALTNRDKNKVTTGIRHDVDFIVDAVEKNPDDAHLILSTLAESWVERTEAVSANERFQRMQLELVIMKLAQRGSSNHKKSALDSGTADTRLAIGEIWD